MDVKRSDSAFFTTTSRKRINHQLFFSKAKVKQGYKKFIAKREHLQTDSSLIILTVEIQDIFVH